MSIDWTQFTKSIAVNTDLETLYNAWTKASELEKWFLKEANFFRQGKEIDKDQNVQAKNTFTWRWYLYDGQEDSEVFTANGKDKLSFRFGGDCIVTVKLKEQFDQIIVEITQSNIPTDEDSQERLRLGCAFGWQFYLVNLKSFYEHGHDLRNKDERFKGLLNN